MYPRTTIARPEHFIVTMRSDDHLPCPVDFSWLRPTPKDPVTGQHKSRLAKELAERIHHCWHRFEISFPQDLCRDMNDDVAILLFRDWTRCPQRAPDDSLFFLGFVTEALLEGCPMLGPMLERHLAEISFTRPLSTSASAYAYERGIDLKWLHPCDQDRRDKNFWYRVKKH